MMSAAKDKPLDIHCVKSVLIRSFFWSVFEYFSRCDFAQIKLRYATLRKEVDIGLIGSQNILKQFIKPLKFDCF